MWLMNSLKAASLDQLDDTVKTGLYIGRQRLEFISNTAVEKFHNASHQYNIAFLQYFGVGAVTRT
jgi:hypothetical protein